MTTTDPSGQPNKFPLSLIAVLGGGLLVGLLMAAVVLLYGSGAGPTLSVGPTSVPDPIKVGNLAPDFTGTTPDGLTYTLSDLHGKVVAVNFWATWCVPCQVEIPELEAAYQQHAGDGLVILAVNAGETQQTVAKAVADMGMTFPAILDEDGTIVDLYGVRVFPTTVWIGPDGKVAVEHIGVLTTDLIDQYLNALLSASPQASAWLP